MKIAFYKAKHGKKLDKVISIFTLSKYSHCEIVFSNGECWSSSSREGGVRGKYIELGDHWDVFELIGDFNEAAIKYWFMSNDGDLYDWFGAVGSLFHIDLSSEDKKFCSYACAIVLGVSPIATPGNLYKTLKKQNLIN